MRRPLIALLITVSLILGGCDPIRKIGPSPGPTSSPSGVSGSARG